MLNRELVGSLLIDTGMCILLWLLCTGIDAYRELKEEIEQMKKLDRKILGIGGSSFLFAVVLKIPWMSKFPFSAFFADTFLGVGSSLTAVGLTKLYEVQEIKKAKSAND